MNFNNDKELYRVIGKNIKLYRKFSKLTQVQLAEKAEISISYLSKIEADSCDKSMCPYLCLTKLPTHLMSK